MPEKRVESMPPFEEGAGETLLIPEGEGLGKPSREEGLEVLPEGENVPPQESKPEIQDAIPTAETLISRQEGQKVYENTLKHPPRSAGAADLEQTLERLFKSRASEQNE